MIKTSTVIIIIAAAAKIIITTTTAATTTTIIKIHHHQSKIMAHLKQWLTVMALYAEIMRITIAMRTLQQQTEFQIS